MRQILTIAFVNEDGFNKFTNWFKSVPACELYYIEHDALKVQLLVLNNRVVISAQEKFAQEKILAGVSMKFESERHN